MIESMFNWLPDSPKLYPFYIGVSKFVDENIDLDSGKNYQNNKVILDPCVGYVELHGWEVAILDTSLFQRLRKTSQLGLAHFVYPTLRYSRFEHTIGVLGRLNQMLQRLKEKHYDDLNINITDILKAHEKAVRLAAIFHDVGHCVFSHLSESVITDLPGLEGDELYPSVSEIIRIFNEKFKLTNGDSLSIAEIFSITILGCKKVAELLKKVKINLDQQINGVEEMAPFTEDVARFIAGLPVKDSPKTVFLAQLISSGLDADKLDYMSREEHFSGIKIEMDLLRIFNKIKLFSISEIKKLPKALLKYGNHINGSVNENVTFIVLGIEKGGQFSYEEYCIARLALYEKIYLHKKVRAAEQFLKSKFQILVNETETFKQAHKWLYLKESVIEKPFKIPLHEIKNNLDLFTQNNNNESYTLDLTDIEKRNIPFTAFTFGPANAKTDYNFVQILEEAELGGVDAIEKLDSVKFWNRFKKAEFLRTFKEKICAEIKEIINFLGSSDGETIVMLPKDLLNKIPSDIVKVITTSAITHKSASKSIAQPLYIDTLFDEDPQLLLTETEGTQINIENNVYERCFVENVNSDKIIIDVPNYRRVQLKYDSLYFEEANYQTIRWTIPINQIARYYQLNRILAYIYSDRSYCPFVLIACEMIIYKEHKMYFDQSSQISKDVKDVIDELRTVLVKNGYYAGYEEIIPFSKELESITAREKINDLLSSPKKLKLFRKKVIRFLDVQNFLRQFPEELQLSALNLVNSIRVLPDEELDIQIEDILGALRIADRDLKVGIIPLGETFSSAIHMLKSFKNLVEKHKINTLNQTDSQIIEQDHLIFFDDNINSGRQALNIFATWIGIDDKVLLEKNRYTDVKSKRDAKTIDNEKIISKLKSTSITFIFITGNEHSANQLKTDLIDICGLKEDLIQVKIKYILKDECGIFSDMTVTNDDGNVFNEIHKNFNYEIDKNKHKLKQFLTDVGTQIVQNRSIITEQKERPEDHALGYNNRQSMVIFPNSIPTMTITALWCEGNYNGKTWLPLIPRNTIIS